MLNDLIRNMAILLLSASLPLFAQESGAVKPVASSPTVRMLPEGHRFASVEICDNGLDDDGDGLVDCEDNDCQILANGGFEDVPTANYPGAYTTFPPYPAFQGSWAAVNIDGEVFVQSDGRPAKSGEKFASLLQNAGSNPRTPWSEISWGGGGYDRFLFIADTYTGTNYDLSFFHASDYRYGYFGNYTLVQVQSLQTDFYFDTLLVTPDIFDWQEVALYFTTDSLTSSVAILFSSYGSSHSSVLVDDLGFCGQQDVPMNAVNDTVSTLLNQPVEIPVLANDEHIPAEEVQLSILFDAGPTAGTVVIQEDGTLLYTPSDNYVCRDSFRYEVCRLQGNDPECSAATVFVTIEGQAPVARDDRDTVLAGGSLQLTVLSNDYDPDNGLNTSSLVVAEGYDPAFGTLTSSGDGTFLYQSSENFTGVDSFLYVVCDVSQPLALRDSAFVYVHVVAPPIVTEPQTYQVTVYEDSSILICSAEPFEVDGDPEVSVLPIHGQWQTDPDGCVLYQPDANFFGSDEFAVIACENGICDTAWYEIEVLPVNDAPVAVPDEVYTPEETDIVIEVLPNDLDIDNALSYESLTVLSPPANGSVLVDDIGILYRPEEDFIGPDTLQYLICDGGSPELCDWAMVVIHVTPTPDTLHVTGFEDSVLVICPDPPGSDEDFAAGSSLYFSDNSGFERADQYCYDYLPEANWYGLDSLWVVVCNGSQLCDTILYIIDILPVNDAPGMRDDAVNVPSGEPIVVEVLNNDNDLVDGGMLLAPSVQLVSLPVHGAVTVKSDGTITYRSKDGYSGPDSLVYSACDNGWPLPGLCGEATLRINVSGPESSECFIPESFSPNGDGLYDLFMIDCLELYPRLELFVYDRFGNQVYDSRGPYQNDWNGMHFRTGQRLGDGTYYWIVRFNNGITRDRAGHILVWR